MELSKLINSISAIQVAGEVERKDISSICYDSRKVKKGSLFAAIQGFSADGHKFILDAIGKGASAVILDNNNAVPGELFTHANVTKILVADSRVALAQASNSFYKEPSKRLRLIGCTGTNGKTTTTWIIKNLLEALGEKSGLVGTISNYIGNEAVESQMTTPESSELCELLLNMSLAGCGYGIMEVSSHSLKLKRVSSLDFKTAVFSNLTQDHLDFHKTKEDYFSSKKILFDMLGSDAFAVTNIDDEFGEKIVTDTKAKVITYGQADSADFIISDITFELKGTRFSLTHNSITHKIDTPLVGIFNAYNLTSALIAVHLQGYAVETIISHIRSLPQVPGRFEVINESGKCVIVDYAHTPDSLEKTLMNIRAITAKGQQVVSVFGCGGNRDKGKRPLMGEIASRLSDKVFITSDNPRFEEPYSIIDDITKGISISNYLVVENREEAIVRAINESETGAVILLAGKGHEDYQIIGDRKIHLSDKEIAAQCLKTEAH